MSCPSVESAMYKVDGRTPEMYMGDHNVERGDEAWPAAVWPTSSENSGTPERSSGHHHHNDVDVPLVASPSGMSSMASPVSQPYSGLYTVVFRLVYDPRQQGNALNHSSVFTPAPTTAGSAHPYEYSGYGMGGQYVPYLQQGVDKRGSAYSEDTMATACQGACCSGVVYGSPGLHPREWQAYTPGLPMDYTRQQGCCGVVPVESCPSPPHHHTGGDGVYMPAGFFTSTPLSQHAGMQFVHTPGLPHATCTGHFAPYGATPIPGAYATTAVASPQQHMRFACYGNAADRHSFYMGSTAVGGSSPDASPVAAMMGKVSEEELRSAMPQQYLD